MKAGRRKRLPGAYFLNRLSNATRASLGLRGAGAFCGSGTLALAASRATVTRGLNHVHSFGWSFPAIRAGIGFRHWNRVDGSKWAHCLQQCSETPHFGHKPLKSVPFGSAMAQL
jgi:hypothetical protein